MQIVLHTKLLLLQDGRVFLPATSCIEVALRFCSLVAALVLVSCGCVCAEDILHALYSFV